MAMLALRRAFRGFHVAIDAEIMHEIPASLALMAGGALFDAVIIFLLVMALHARNAMRLMLLVRHFHRRHKVIGLLHAGPDIVFGNE